MSENTTSVIIDTDAAEALVATIRAAVNGAKRYAAYVEANRVTRETVKDHAAALAAMVYPNDKPVQKANGTRTRYGNAVQAAGNGLRRALADVTEPTAAERDYLAAVLKSIEAAVKHNIDPARVLDAAMAHLDSLSES